MSTLITMLSLVFLVAISGCSREKASGPTADQGVKPVAQEQPLPGEQNLTPEARAQIDAYHALQQALEQSPFVFRNGHIVGDSELGSVQGEQLALIQSTYDKVKDQVELPEGTKIITQKGDDQMAVVFSHRLPPGSRGGDFTAQVILDAQGKVLQIVRGE